MDKYLKCHSAILRPSQLWFGVPDIERPVMQGEERLEGGVWGLGPKQVYGGSGRPLPGETLATQLALKDRTAVVKKPPGPRRAEGKGRAV